MSINVANWSDTEILIMEAPASQLDDFCFLVTGAEIPDSVWTALKSDGGDLRFHINIDGTEQMPIHIVNFDKADRAGTYVYTKLDLINASNRTFYASGGNASESQPAVGAAFGTQATFIDYTVVVSQDGTTNLVDGSALTNFNVTTTGADNPLGLASLSFFTASGQSPDYIETTIPSLAEYTAGLWYYPRGVDVDGNDLLIMQDPTNRTNGWAAIVDDASPNDIGILTTNESWLRSGVSRSLNTWQHVTMVGSDLNNNRAIYIDGAVEASGAIVNQTTNRTLFRLGNRVPSVTTYETNAAISHVFLKPVAEGADYLAYEELNRSNNSGFFNGVLPTDTVAPVISLLGQSTVTITQGDTYTDAGATATDNVDASVTVNTDNPVNTAIPATYTVTYTASDQAGNVATPVTRTVIVEALVVDPDVAYADWQHEKVITIDSTIAKTNKDVAIYLTSDNFNFNNAKSDGSDIRFGDATQTLSYWIESWTVGRAKIHVKIPSLTIGTQTIRVFSGNASATSESSGSDVFLYFNALATTGDLADLASNFGSSTWSVVVDADSPTGNAVQVGDATTGVYDGRYKALDLPAEYVVEMSVASKTSDSSWAGALMNMEDADNWYLPATAINGPQSQVREYSAGVSTSHRLDVLAGCEVIIDEYHKQVSRIQPLREVTSSSSFDITGSTSTVQGMETDNTKIYTAGNNDKIARWSLAGTLEEDITTTHSDTSVTWGDLQIKDGLLYAVRFGQTTLTKIYSFNPANLAGSQTLVADISADMDTDANLLVWTGKYWIVGETNTISVNLHFYIYAEDWTFVKKSVVPRMGDGGTGWQGGEMKDGLLYAVDHEGQIGVFTFDNIGLEFELVDRIDSGFVDAQSLAYNTDTDTWYLADRAGTDQIRTISINDHASTKLVWANWTGQDRSVNVPFYEVTAANLNTQSQIGISTFRQARFSQMIVKQGGYGPIVSLDEEGADTTAPVITLNGSSPTTIAQNIAYVDRGATAVDNRDGIITDNIVATGSVNTAVLGEYSITYNVDDSSGNSATPVVRVVSVVESSEVPITDRETVRRVASYLRTQGYTGSDNDVIMQWLGVEGYAGGYNDKWDAYLSVQGFTTGGLQDKYTRWKNE